MIRRLLAPLTTTAIVAGLALGAAAPSADAVVQCSTNRFSYDITNVSVSRIATNLRSDYLAGPGTLTYSQTKAAEANASASASVTAEAGVVFAKASATAGVTVGASYTKSGTWTYSKSVPRGRTARLVLFHESRRFTVTKHRLDPGGCRRVGVVYSETVNAPVKRDLNVWDLQFA